MSPRRADERSDIREGGQHRPRMSLRSSGLRVLTVWQEFSRNDVGIATHIPLSSPRRRGSSTPLLLGSITAVSGILDRPPSRTMTTGCDFALSRRMASEVCYRISLPSCSEGAGKTGCTPHPRSRVQFAHNNAHTSIQVRLRHPGLPCAMALRLTSCSPRRTALLPPSSPRSFASLGLSASTAAPEPHDFAVRLSRTR